MKGTKIAIGALATTLVIMAGLLYHTTNKIATLSREKVWERERVEAYRQELQKQVAQRIEKAKSVKKPAPAKTPKPKPANNDVAANQGYTYSPPTAPTYTYQQPKTQVYRGAQAMRPIQADNSYEATMARSREMLRQYQTGEVKQNPPVKPYEDLRDAGDKKNHY